MIIIGSAVLLAIGLLVLLWQAIVISYHLLRLAVLLVIWCGYAVVLVVCGVGLAAQYVMGWGKPEPVITVNTSPDDEDVPTIELPRESFHRVRG
jgi:hypothetical protein